MSHKPGGGLHSKVVKHSTNPKVEPRPHARNPARVSQYGQMQGNHVTTHGGGKTDYRGDPDFTHKGYSQPVGPTSFSNISPGGGRTVMKSGQQNQWGAPNPGNAPAKGKDILSSFGPDYKARS
jgi:hypothetical protein